jgi:Tfp pilus assembly protein PilF
MLTFPIYYNYLNETDLALSSVNKAIEINPNDKDYFTLRAQIKYNNNEIESAIEDYSIAKKNN